MSDEGPYVLKGGLPGKQRLDLLTRLLEPTTERLLRRAGLVAGMRCLDVGCGGGGVSRLIARLVGTEGTVLGLDLDPEKLRLARADTAEEGLHNVRFEQVDARQLDEPPVHDLVYARFLVTYLPDPVNAVRRMLRALRPGGALVVEDIDFSGHVCHPPSRAFSRYQELFRAAVKQRGGDADIGPRLPEVLLEAGTADLDVSLAQPVFLAGEGKGMARLTLQNLGDTLIAQGLVAREELDALIAELDTFTRDQRTLLSLPRVFQVWGRRH